jgi:hypothetical protein
MQLPQDFADLIPEFDAAEVRYLVSGGYAVGVHDRPRATKDLDVYLDPSTDNIDRACVAFGRFGAPTSITSDLLGAAADEIVWWGTPPLRIDFLKSVPGIDFDEAYSRREQVHFGAFSVSVLGITDLIASKRAAGGDQDLVDAKRLERRLAQRKR